MKIPPLTYTNATVIHTNKYSQNTGFVVSSLFFQNVILDVVFRIDATGEEFSTSYANPSAILYPQQKITLISIDGDVIAFFDKPAGKYYYLSNNLSRVLSYNIDINWALLIVGIFVLLLLIEQFAKPEQPFHFLLILIPIALWIYERIMNGYAEASLDKQIQEDLQKIVD
jgi:hypothetical protein